MKQIIDDGEHAKQTLDTPWCAPQSDVAEAHKRRDPNYLLDCPGVGLRTKERGVDGFPDYFGKLTSHSAMEVIVISKETPGRPRCVWTGTESQYLSMWEVD